MVRIDTYNNKCKLLLHGSTKIQKLIDVAEPSTLFTIKSMVFIAIMAATGSLPETK
jgi:hypothetical protein